MAGDVYTEFEWRGMVVERTEGVRELLAGEKVTAYIGFDPTASSLHVGSLLVVTALARLQRFGHHPIAIAGGGTGMIGDPSGKSQERSLLSAEQVEENLRGIKAQLAHFLDFDSPTNPARIVNNADWLMKLNLIDFLRDIGKYFTVNYMLAKESVKRRLEQEEGISYTEFTYLMLQAYDFLELSDRYGCRLQMGGSDQWGNITAGCELIRRLRGRQAHGLVLPLVTTSSGAKFGKTEAGTVWLDPARTSPFRFYQFWLNTDDRDVGPYLKYFTFLDQDEIAALDRETTETPEKRVAQRELAREVTRLVHGEDAARRAATDSEALFGSVGEATSAREVVQRLLAGSAEVPKHELPRTPEGSVPLVKVLTSTGLAPSTSEARRLIRGGGVYLNGERVTDDRRSLTSGDAQDDWILLQKGSRQRFLVKLNLGSPATSESDAS